MLVSSNADKVAKSLSETSEELRRKLTNMVVGFATEVAQTASENTPVGNADDLIANAAYREYYLKRFDDYGIPVEIGYHRGAWQYNEGDPYMESQLIFTSQEAVSNVTKDARRYFKLGDSFTIGAEGPGYGALNAGSSSQARQGIMKPTVAHIQTAHSSDLKRYFDAG